jgi:hypothetical protein
MARRPAERRIAAHRVHIAVWFVLAVPIGALLSPAASGEDDLSPSTTTVTIVPPVALPPDPPEPDCAHLPTGDGCGTPMYEPIAGGLTAGATARAVRQ